MVLTKAKKENSEYWSLEYGLILPDEYTVRVEPIKRDFKYYFYKPNGDIVDQYTAGHPTTLTTRSNIGKTLKSHIDVNGEASKKVIDKTFMELKLALSSFLDYYNQSIEELKKQEEQTNENERALRIENAMDFFNV